MALETHDPRFLERADAHIQTANDQLKEGTPPSRASASLSFAAARFHAWLWSNAFSTKEDMQAQRAVALQNFLAENQRMFEENFDNYVANYDDYKRGAE